MFATIKGNYFDIKWLIAKFLKQLRELTQECIAPDERILDTWYCSFTHEQLITQVHALKLRTTVSYQPNKINNRNP